MQFGGNVDIRCGVARGRRGGVGMGSDVGVGEIGGLRRRQEVVQYIRAESERGELEYDLVD